MRLIWTILLTVVSTEGFIKDALSGKKRHQQNNSAEEIGSIRDSHAPRVSGQRNVTFQTEQPGGVDINNAHGETDSEGHGSVRAFQPIHVSKTGDTEPIRHDGAEPPRTHHTRHRVHVTMDTRQTHHSGQHIEITGDRADTTSIDITVTDNVGLQQDYAMGSVDIYDNVDLMSDDESAAYPQSNTSLIISIIEQQDRQQTRKNEDRIIKQIEKQQQSSSPEEKSRDYETDDTYILEDKQLHEPGHRQSSQLPTHGSTFGNKDTNGHRPNTKHDHKAHGRGHKEVLRHGHKPHGTRHVGGTHGNRTTRRHKHTHHRDNPENGQIDATRKYNVRNTGQANKEIHIDIHESTSVRERTSTDQRTGTTYAYNESQVKKRKDTGERQNQQKQQLTQYLQLESKPLQKDYDFSSASKLCLHDFWWICVCYALYRVYDVMR